METTVQKWGNSYAVRLPLAAVRKTLLTAGQTVRIEVNERGLSIVPLKDHERSLAALVTSITPHNRHGIVAYGTARGNEAW